MIPNKSLFLENLPEFLRGAIPEMERRLLHLEANLPDPVRQPVSSALVAAYLFRLRIQLSDMQRGLQGLLDQYNSHPTLARELLEIDPWISDLMPVIDYKPAEERENRWGDSLVRMGYSYTDAKRQIRHSRRHVIPRGAPSKRTKTVAMLDARIANGWSYPRVASEMCDCEKPKHDAHCADSIRKRIKELEEFLNRYQIAHRKHHEAPEKKRD